MYQLSCDCSISESIGLQLEGAFLTLEHLQICFQELEIIRDVLDGLAVQAQPASIRGDLHLRSNGLGVTKLDAVGNLLENYTSEVESFYSEMSMYLQRIESMLEELKVI